MFNTYGFLSMVLLLSMSVSCNEVASRPCASELANMERSAVSGQGHEQRLVTYQECLAGNGDRNAMMWLAEQYEKGSAFVELDPEKAFAYYQMAASDAEQADGTRTEGLAEAKFRVGKMFAEGRGASQSNEKAWEMIHEAARAGHKEAVVWLHEFEIELQKEKKKAEGQRKI